MSDGLLQESSALEALYGPSDYPNRHRARSAASGAPEVLSGRRPSPVGIVQALREEVSGWRDNFYVGASATSRALFAHWFDREHGIVSSSGERFPFSYYFCQREAVETVVYLYELRRARSLSSVIAQFGGADAEIAALGISPEEDEWARYAIKMATGSGKTKVMSLLIAWSYFHALFEQGSEMASDFLVIAPGLTVFERLKQDFCPDDGPDVFNSDPVVPPGWRGDWNLSVVLQDEAAMTGSVGGTLYLTNIHRLYPKRPATKASVDYDWMGPAVVKSSAYDTSLALRARIAAHGRLMVLNDEAHHVWDPNSTWNDALRFLNEAATALGGGIVTQLDLTATPRDNRGEYFRHVVVDTPLGEAVDSGIVKSPIIGKGDQLVERAHDNAAFRYEHHLMLGHKRWQVSFEEWKESGKKPVMFVMTESTQAADEIAERLNTDPLFAEFNSRTINLHTNLKGSLKKVGGSGENTYEFVENENQISDDDLRELRRISRELDSDDNPYRCIVSVLMLREGWDVKNVTTIVPLRALSADSKILAEQTLGRGLRRMTPPGIDQPAETVTVIEHPSFVHLYEEQLGDEGLPIASVEAAMVPTTTVSIFPDHEGKDVDGLDIEIPALTPGYTVAKELGPLTFDDVRRQFGQLEPLPLGVPHKREIEYEGRHLITNELVEQMTVSLPLLEDGFGAVSFYREEVERACRIRGTHAQLAPLIQRFIEELLFGGEYDLYDERLITRLADSDVREYTRAVFVPLVLDATVSESKRLPAGAPRRVSAWLPFQVSHSDSHPVEKAKSTPFNLVPCNRSLEQAMAGFLDRASDVRAFAKNAGPQALRIDCLSSEGQRVLYTPDFLIRLEGGSYILAETKGQVGADVATKAVAAVAWCKAASTPVCKWSYLYVQQGLFEQFGGAVLGDLARTCAPSLKALIGEASSHQAQLPFDLDAEQARAELLEFIDAEGLAELRGSEQYAIEQAVQLYSFLREKPDVLFGPIFQPLLWPIDRSATALIVKKLHHEVPEDKDEQAAFFDPGLGRSKSFQKERGRALKKLLVYQRPLMPAGVLKFCLEYAAGAGAEGGVFAAIKLNFAELVDSELPSLIEAQYVFRNTYIAHTDAEPLTDREQARNALVLWINAIRHLSSKTRA